MKKNKIKVKDLMVRLLTFFLVSIAVMLFVLDSQKPDIPEDLISQICTTIDSLDEKYYCLAVVNKEGAFCKEISGDNDRNFCFAMAERSFAFCNKIKQQELEESCYYELTLLTKQPEYCENLEKEEYCYFSYISCSYLRSNFDEIKTEYCNKLSEGGTADIDTCFALQAQDRSLCHNRLFCLTFFEYNLSLCTGIKGDSKFGCFRDRALTSRDSSICENITDSYWKDDCYSDYAIHIDPDVSICDNILTSRLKNMCYAGVAIRLAE